MLWDMEGVSGLFRRPEVWFWEPDATAADHERGRDLLTADVNNAVQAALDAGVDELIVCDTHHGGGNLKLDGCLQDPRVTWLPKPTVEIDGQRRWLPGLDEATDGFMLPGHHAKAGTRKAFVPHTWMGTWADFRINGQSVGELGIESCFAGHFGVPLVLVQGDAACCREAAATYPGVVTAEVKQAVDRDRCTGPTAEEGRRITAEKVAEAVSKLRADPPPPFQPELPMTIQVRFWSSARAELAAEKTGAKRVNRHTLEQVVERRADVVKWITGAGLP